MARPKSMTIKQEQFITEATKLGMSSREIAEQIGMTHTTVQRYQRSHGLKYTKQQLPLTFNNF